MDSTDSRESSAKTRAKRKIVVKAKNINIRAHKRLNTRSNTIPTIPSLPIPNTSTPLTHIPNTNNRNDKHNNNTQPNSSQFNLNGKQKSVIPQPRTTINLLNKFSSVMENIASTSHSNTHGSNVHTNVNEDGDELNDPDAEMYDNDANISDNDDGCEGDSNSDYQSESDSDVDDIQGYDDIGDPIWECPHCGAYGVLYRQRRIANNLGLQLDDEQIYNLTLLEIEKMLEQHTEFNQLFTLLTDEQKLIFEKIMNSVNNQKVGEGKLEEPNDGIANIRIPDELLITTFDDPISAIIDSTYPDLLENNQNYDFLSARAILASTIEVVNKINNVVLQLLPGEEHEYLSADSLDRSEMDEGAKDDSQLHFSKSKFVWVSYFRTNHCVAMFGSQ
ncbi:ATP-dependent DNA helicase PIF1 [Trifolium repens]|nr:ATP-dependent DNA helicase PIF1 [Trifolium repens]